MASAAMIAALLLITLRTALGTRMTAWSPNLFELFFFCAFSFSRCRNGSSCRVYLSSRFFGVSDRSILSRRFDRRLSALA